MKELTELVRNNLTKLEELVRRFFDHHFESAQDLWNVEVGLARYQIDLRNQIRKEEDWQRETKSKVSKIAFSKDNGWKEVLQQLHQDLGHSDQRIDILKHAHMLSKQFGDAFAWVFLKGDVAKIAALAINAPNPSIPEGLSLHAMLGVAEGFSNAGAGFPLIHDVTNCLRVGDLTFCNLLDVRDEPLTIEVKSKLLSVEGKIANFEVGMYAPAPQPKFEKVLETLHRRTNTQDRTDDSSDDPAASAKLLGRGPRLERQVERMARSRSLQTASHLETIHQEGNNILAKMSVALDAGSFHWNIVRDLAIEAKKKGYATVSVDDAFFYAVTYSDTAPVYPWSGRGIPHATEISREVQKSFPFCSEEKNDHICFRTSWDYFSGDVPPYIRPFLAYDLPLEMCLDILWRRLSIIVYINISKVVRALNQAGIEARVPANANELNHQFIPTAYTATLADGQVVEVRGGSLNEFANKIGLEFMSLDAFVSCVSQTIEATVEITKRKTEEALLNAVAK